MPYQNPGWISHPIQPEHDQQPNPHSWGNSNNIPNDYTGYYHELMEYLNKMGIPQSGIMENNGMDLNNLLGMAKNMGVSPPGMMGPWNGHVGGHGLGGSLNMLGLLNKSSLGPFGGLLGLGRFFF